MTEKVTEASLAIDLAKAFGRTPPSWAVEAHRTELSEAGKPSMSVNEALNVKCSAVFRPVDAGRLAEADAVLRPAGAGSSDRADLQGRMTALMNEVSSLSESRLGLSEDRARLHAQSEALDARERSGSVAEAVKAFERYRDVLIKRPIVERKAR